MIRPLKETEYGLLDSFLYEAIFVPEGMQPPPRSILLNPELQVYVSGFGTQEADTAFAAEKNGRVIGAAWARMMEDYGHIDEQTPSLVIALLPEYRNQGVGRALLTELVSAVKEKGFSQVSLSVQKANRAFHLYQRVGFEIAWETENEYGMVKDLRKRTQS